MATQIQLGDLTIDVVRKPVKNINLRVCPPDGDVRISAPSHVRLDAVHAFAVTKQDWIERQRKKIRARGREPVREYVDGEEHLVWGEPRQLSVIEVAAPPAVELQGERLLLQVRPGAARAKRRAVVEGWYREQIKRAVPPLIAHWEPLMKVQVARFFVQRMKTRWGSCNYRARNIRLNSELAKKPHACLDYVVMHEMTHILEPSHNARFYALMDGFMPEWPAHRAKLNRLPVGVG